MSASESGGVDQVLESLLADEPAGGDDERRVADAELAPHGRARVRRPA